MNVTLVLPTLSMEKAYFDFSGEWAANHEEITPYSARLLGQTYPQWLESVYKMQTEAPANFVTAHTYFLVDSDETILGAVNIRHYLNDFLLQTGGHIGYGIRPSRRREGFAKEMLKQALPLAKKLGIGKALVTCDRENTGSAKTILANGGVLENEVEQDGEITQRYWIALDEA